MYDGTKSPLASNIHAMAKFQMVQVSDAPFRSTWTIEEVTPGEKPIPIPVYGSRSEVAAELSRLNTGGEIAVKILMPVRRSKRVPNKPPAG